MGLPNLSRRDFLEYVSALTLTNCLGSINCLSSTAYYQDDTEIERNKLIEMYKNAQKPKLTLVKNDEKHRLYSLKPSIIKDGISDHEIIIKYFPAKYFSEKPNSEEEKPMVIILPMIAGETFVERGLAHFYQQNNLNSAITDISADYRISIKRGLEKIEKSGDIEIFVDKFNNVFQQVLFDYMQTLDTILENESFRTSNIGAQGISIGGIILTSLIGVDERIKAGISLLAGGNLPEIISNSTEPGIKREREKIKKKLKISDEEFKEALRGKIPLDPANLAKYIDSKKMMLFIAGNDSTVPYKNGIELAERLPKAKVEHLNGLTHYSAIIAMPIIKRKSLKFLEERLKL